MTTVLCLKQSQVRWDVFKTKQGSYVDQRPFTTEVPPIGKIHPFSKIIVTLETVIQIGSRSRFRISKTNCNMVYNLTKRIIFNH